MKKKILSIISVFVAMLMCFSLVACNDANEPDPKPTPDTTDTNVLPADKTLQAIDTLLTAHGYKADAKVTTNSEFSPQPITVEYAFEKKGDVFKVTEDGESDTYLNLNTGFSYYETEEGLFAYEQAIPSGYAAYLKDVAYGLLPQTPEEKLELYKKLQDAIEYDSETNTGTYKLALKEIVNLLVLPAQNSYKGGKDSVLYVIDTYLKIFVADSSYNSLDKILTHLMDKYDDVKDASIGELLKDIEDEYGVSVKDLLMGMDMELPEEAWEAIDTRTVGEALTALADYITGKMNENGGEGEYDMDEVFEAINAALFAPVNPSDVALTPLKLQIIKATLIATLDSFTFKDAIDLYGDALPPDLVLLITKDIKMTKLNLEVKFTFDDDYNFSKITLDAAAAHNYTHVEGDGAEFFANNNYELNIELDISDYTTEGEFTFELAERDYNPDSVEIAVIVRADANTASYDFYYEEGSEITVSNYAFYNISGEPYDGMDNAVTYDAATKTFSVKSASLSPIFSAENFYAEQSATIFMTATVEYGEGETYVLNVKFFVVEDASLNSAINTSIPIFSALFGGSDGEFGEYPDFDYQPEE